MATILLDLARQVATRNRRWIGGDERPTTKLPPLATAPPPQTAPASTGVCRPATGVASGFSKCFKDPKTRKETGTL